MTNKIQVSYSEGRDGRIFVIGGETFDEFFANAGDVLGAESSARLVEDFAALVDPPSAQPSQPAPRSAPATNAAPPAPGSPECRHGARTHRTGEGKKGTWSAWFCSQPKGSDQCDPLWG
jgi:hypothetical protein